jgi:predicted metalloprotease
MRWEGNRESSNVEDRRGIGIGGGSIGIGSVVIALIASYFFGINPAVVLNLLGGGGMPVASEQSNQPPATDRESRFVRTVLADTEDTWTALFRQQGGEYAPPKLVLFSGMTQTACGTGQSATGPFYCPADQNVYIDLSFYRLMQERFQVSGEFAQAYVIAHEVAHHVQNLLGISGKVHQARSRLSEKQANEQSVRLELQADCFAGLWAFHANQARGIIESGDVESALNAATAIGDDALQRQGQGQVVPDSFTHGTSAQRVAWFKRGLQSGEVRDCDTFNTNAL